MRIWSYPGIYPFPEKGDHTTGIFIHKQNLSLKKLGCEINVIIPRDWYPVWPFYNIFNDWKVYQKQGRPSERELDGINIYHPLVVSPKPSRLFKKPHDESLIEATCNFLKKQGVKKGNDVILAQWLIPEGRIAVLAAKRLGIPVAVEMQGDDVQVFPHNSPIHLKHAKWVLQNADLMLGCSDFLGIEANKLLSEHVKIHTIYTGIDLNKFKPAVSTEERNAIRAKYGLKENDIVILNVGSAIARKGWLELIEALGRIKQDNIKLLAAVGVYRELDLYEVCQKHGIQNNLIDLGQVTNDELPFLYQACDIFCLPSYWEGLANALCEAMASGCAIITTAVSGHPEVVQSGFNGELVHAKDVDLLTNAIKKLTTDPELRKFYSQNARKTAEDKIKSHEANGEKLLGLLNKIM